MDYKVSVLVPVYNSFDYLKNLTKCLKNQTYKNLEIIFVNDGSTDKSIKLLKRAGRKLNNAKLIEHDKNKGLFWARLTGLKACSGDYICFLDSDDFVDEDFYQKMLEKIVESNADICISDYVETIVQTGKERTPRTFLMKDDKDYENYSCFEKIASQSYVDQGYLYAWNKMISKKLFQKCEKYIDELSLQTEGLLMGEDNLYSIIFLSNAEKVVISHQSKYHYCQHNKQSVSFQEKDKFLRQLKSSIKSFVLSLKYLKEVGLYDKYKPQKDAWLRIYKNDFMSQSYKYRCPSEYRKILKEYLKEEL